LQKLSLVLPLEDIILPPKQWKKLRRDKGQIEEMRRDVEQGETMIPIVVYRRPDGKYGIEDGRHRYIAHVLADTGTIDAIIYEP